MKTTPEMIEAADKVLSAEFSNTLDTADLARRAITAALALLPSAPVAYQMKIQRTGRWASLPEDWQAHECRDGDEYRALYTSPTPHPAVDRDGLREEARAIATKIVGQKAFLALTTGDGQPYAKVTFPEQEGLRSFTDGMIELRAFLSKLEGSSNA